MKIRTSESALMGLFVLVVEEMAAVVAVVGKIVVGVM